MRMKNIQRLCTTEAAFANEYKLGDLPLNELSSLRQKIPAETAQERMALWIAAPVLASFALWMKNQARGKDDLFLGVMREGRLLSRLMKRLFDLDTKEIWLNRHLSMLAAFGAGDDESLLNWLVRTRIEPLSLREAHVFLLGNPGNTSDEALDLSRAQSMLELWRRNGALEQARQKAKAIGARLLKHWDSIVPDKSDPVFLMDFACAGNIQRSLRTVFLDQGREDRLIGLNFATTSGVVWAKQKGGSIRGFLCEDGAPDWTAAAVARTPELIEIFASAPLGPLEDFEENGTPLCGESFLTAEQKTWTQAIQDKIVEAAALCAREESDILTPELARVLWTRLLRSPMRSEADAVGDWPLDAGLDGKPHRKLAPPLDDPERLSDKKMTAWPVASLLRA